MKRALLSSTVLLLAVLLFLFSALFAEDINTVVNANNQFAFELYSRYKSEKGNIFFSPYSISAALAMTYEGARGKTADEIQTVFHFPKDSAVRRKSFLKTYNQTNKKDKKYQLHTANALWAQKDYPFQKSYFGLMEEFYGGKVTNLDFRNKTEESRLTINNWVEKQTNGKIKDLIPRNSLNPSFRLVITNAVYFKGLWARQFDKQETAEKDFRVNPVRKVKVQMMNKKSRFGYAEIDDLQIVELPYEGQELSMFVLLPKKGNLDSLEKSLDTQKISTLIKSLKEKKVDVYLPEFKFSAKYFVADTLKRMGMATAFSENADFSGMTGKKDLFINEVIHQAFVEVNEKGTEAAAATGVTMGMTAMPELVKIFNADHPFIFMIQEKKTENILFLGRVSDPTA